jgi:hypothetical protein
MNTSVTVRLSAAQRAKLRQKAKRLGKTESAFIREILDRELEPRPMGEKIGHLAGSLKLKGTKMDEWQKSIYQNNWRW